MRTARNTIMFLLILVGAGLVFDIDFADHGADSELLAARYHARQRTTQFFQKSGNSKVARQPSRR